MVKSSRWSGCFGGVCEDTSCLDCLDCVCQYAKLSLSCSKQALDSIMPFFWVFSQRLITIAYAQVKGVLKLADAALECCLVSSIEASSAGFMRTSVMQHRCSGGLDNKLALTQQARLLQASACIRSAQQISRKLSPTSSPLQRFLKATRLASPPKAACLLDIFSYWNAAACPELL